MTLPRIANTFLERAIDFFAILAGALIIFLMFGVSADVVLRYFLSSPIPNMQEIAQQTLLLVTFLSATWILKTEGHTKVDILLGFLNPRTRRRLNAITSIAGSLICLIFFWYALKVTWIDFHRHALVSTEFRIPYAAIFIIAPIGYFLLFVQFLKRSRAFLKDPKSSQGGA
jgi:TRAP-type C4-dicarboxylate transport system permease small subunit